MTEQEQMKALIRGTAIENGAEAEFNECIDNIRMLAEQQKQKGEKNEAAFYMALAYFGAGVC